MPAAGRTTLSPYNEAAQHVSSAVHEVSGAGDGDLQPRVEIGGGTERLPVAQGVLWRSTRGDFHDLMDRAGRTYRSRPSKSRGTRDWMIAGLFLLVSENNVAFVIAMWPMDSQR
jgi:hypothetical protein